jgi:LysM repeat protein
MRFPDGAIFGTIFVKRCPPVVGFAMLRTDLVMPSLPDPSSVARPTSHFVKLTCSGILIISCTIFGFSQCYAQDVADAARQEQARKQNQQKKSKHVYTDEDLKHAQILTPEDRAEVEARKARQPLPGEENAQEPLDAQALPPGEPLGDVARRYRKQRELLRLQQSAQFHLPFIEETVHASPKPSVLAEIKPPVLDAPKVPVMPLRTIISIPSPPPRVEPFQPPVKRSPFEHPRVFSSAPPRVAPSQPLANHAAPPQPPAVSTTPALPSTIPVATAKPAAPAPAVRLMPPNRTSPRVTPAEPAAPVVQTAPYASTLPVTPSKPAAPGHDFSVMPAPGPAAHIAPAQPAAPMVGAMPSHPSPLFVTPSEPAATKPDLSVMPAPAPVAGVSTAQPTAAAVPAVPAQPSVISVAPSKPVAPAPDLSRMPAPAPTARVAPAKPVAPVVPAAPAQPSVISVTLSKPVAPAPDLRMPSPSPAARISPAPPAAPIVRAAPSKASPIGITPSQPAVPVIPVVPPRKTPPAVTAPAGPAKLNVLTVQPGDSLWKLAQQNLGNGLRWHDLLAANPAIVDPNHIVAGSHIFLPSVASRFRTATRIIIHNGDTLSEIARTQLGRASYWTCVAHANPSIHDANRIYQGQSLVLPASCKQ